MIRKFGIWPLGVAVLVSGCVTIVSQPLPATDLHTWARQTVAYTAAEQANMPEADRVQFTDCMGDAITYKMPDDVQARLLAIINKPVDQRTTEDKNLVEDWTAGARDTGVKRIMGYMKATCPDLLAKYPS